ncbi:MAG: Gfo/Idh/MocA family oxidoreductase [Balneolales bacterium]
MNKSNSNKYSRKSFIKKAGASATGLLGVPSLFAGAGSGGSVIELQAEAAKKYAINDHIQIATIGCGKMGQGDTRTALQVDGVKLVAACDLYDSRLERCKEVFGNDIYATRDYREVLSRPDVDAVIIATSDHWHDTITIEALNSNKAVYVEKPMVHRIEQGYAVIEAERNSTQPLTVGAQGTSSLINEKARQLLSEGVIGKLNFIEAYTDRFSYGGAWQYPIPPSASPENIDWDTYLKDYPRIPFDPKRFFWYRNYQDYGTGVSGDLFVHLFAGIHQITGSKGPTGIMATGGLRLWDDGRDVADVLCGLYDYPETEAHPGFTLSLRVNFADGSGGGSHMRFVGTEGEMVSRGGSLIIRTSELGDAPGSTNFGEFAEKEREELGADYARRHAGIAPRVIEPNEFTYRTPQGFNSRKEHFVNLFKAMRDGSKVFHDAAYGLRSAAPALATNLSHREQKIIKWDPEKMELV